MSELIQWAENHNCLSEVDDYLDEAIPSETRSTTPARRSAKVPQSSSVDPNARNRAREFLEFDWLTYGIRDLKNGDIFSDSPEIVEQFDRLTDLLARGAKRNKREAARMLGEWCQKHPNHDWTPAFRLRRALCLKVLGDWPTARKEVHLLLQEAPDSATLHCLLGVLFSWEGKHTDAREQFRIAIDLASDWVEPRLQMVEEELLLGEFDNAARDAESLQQLADLTSRENLIAQTYGIVARVLDEPAFFNSKAYKAAFHDVERITVEEGERESWFPTDIARVVKKQVPAEPTRSDATESKQGRMQSELLDLLRSLHRKLNESDPLF